MARQRRILGTPFLRFEEEGQTYTGKLVDRIPMKFPNGDSYQYTLEINGIKCKMNGGEKIDDALADAPLGIEIEVTYHGKIQTYGGFWMNDISIAQLLEEEEEYEAE